MFVLAAFRSNGLRSPLVQSTILELQKVDYETWASKVSRTPETSGEFVAWLKQNLPSFLKMASNPTAYLLTPHALFGLVEFLPPKDQWSVMHDGKHNPHWSRANVLRCYLTGRR
jgi:hypothetical protein